MFSCPFVGLAFGAVRKVRLGHEEHKGARRFTKKTNLDKHLCGLSNLKSIGRTRRRESTRKPFSSRSLAMIFLKIDRASSRVLTKDRTPNYKRITWARTFNAEPEQSEGCVLAKDRTPNYKRLTWHRTFNAEPEQSEGSPLEQVGGMRPGCRSCTSCILRALRDQKSVQILS